MKCSKGTFSIFFFIISEFKIVNMVISFKKSPNLLFGSDCHVVWFVLTEHIISDMTERVLSETQLVHHARIDHKNIVIRKGCKCKLSIFYDWWAGSTVHFQKKRLALSGRRPRNDVCDRQDKLV